MCNNRGAQSWTQHCSIFRSVAAPSRAPAQLAMLCHTQSPLDFWHCCLHDKIHRVSTPKTIGWGYAVRVFVLRSKWNHHDIKCYNVVYYFGHLYFQLNSESLNFHLSMMNWLWLQYTKWSTQEVIPLIQCKWNNNYHDWTLVWNLMQVGWVFLVSLRNTNEILSYSTQTLIA